MREWRQLIDRLYAWGGEPSQLDEEGTTTPSRDTIAFAIRLANNLCEGDMLAPTRIVPSAHGEIVFEWHEGEFARVFRVKPVLKGGVTQ